MIEVENIDFKLYKDFFNTCLISIKNKDNQLIIECKTNFNDYTYSLIMNFPDYNNLLFFSSSNEAINFFLKAIYKKKIFFKAINISEIIIGVYTDVDEDNILDNIFDNIYILKLNKVNDTQNISNTIINNEQNIKVDFPKRKKNEYVLWKDPNFNKPPMISYKQIFKLMCNGKENMNIFFETSMEKALKFLLKNRNDRVILASNIGLDLNGKRFIQLARKILGFDIIIFFFQVIRII